MLNRIATLKVLKKMQANIKYRDNEDMAAFEFCDEIESVIEAIESGKTDNDVIKAAEWVGQDSDLVYEAATSCLG